MASTKQIRDEIMRMTIIVNSDPAQKEIHRLSESTRNYKEDNEKLTASLKQLEKARSSDEKAINSYANKIDKLKFANGQQQIAAINEIASLKKVQAQYAEGSAKYMQYEEKIRKVRSESKTATESYSNQIKALTDKQRPLIAGYDKLGNEINDVTNKIELNNRAIDKNNQEVVNLTQSLKLENMTYAQLKMRMNELRTMREHAIPGTEHAKNLNKEMAAVGERIAMVNDGANQTRNSFRNLADQFNHYSGLVAAGAAVLVGFGITVQQIIDRNNKMADAMSGVEKTTGMTRKEVEELTRTFSDFDTRTKKIDLLKIAEVGGRLGVAKSEIKDFTQEVDKAYVALGDSWQGGVDKLADSMGRIAGLYSETKNQPIAKSINEIGSALNELAAQGASSEQNIADFVTRMGRVPEALRPPLNTLLGFGSAFEESGVNAEIASSGFSKFIRVAANSVSQFATVMNEPVEKVRQMINTDPSGFFLKFAEGVKNMNADELAQRLDYLKLSDNEVQGAIGAASQNVERFRQSVDLANKSVAEGTSLQNEFNKVNNNAAAIWEKTQRKIAELFTNQAFAQWLNGMVSAFGKFIGAIEDTDGNITGFRNGLLVLVKVFTLVMATMVSYNLVTGVYNALLRTSAERVLGLTIVEKARNVVVATSNALATLYRATLWLLAAGYSLLTGNVTGATFAMRGFTAAIAANPLGALLTLVTLAATAYYTFSKRTKEAAGAQKSLNDIMAEARANTKQEIAQMDHLYRMATNVKASIDKRKEATAELQKIYPQVFGNLSQEIIMNGKAQDSYLKLRQSIVDTARARAAQSEIDKREQSRLEYDLEWRKKYASEVLVNSELRSRGDGKTLVGNTLIENKDLKKASDERLQIMINERKKWNIENQRADRPLIGIIGKGSKNETTTDELNTSGFKVPTTSAGNDRPKPIRTGGNGRGNSGSGEDPYKKMIEEWEAKAEAAKEKARDIQLSIEDARIEAMQEGYDKEIDLINLQEQRKLAEIDKQKIDASDFKKLDAAIEKAKGQDKELFEALKRSWLDNNASLEEYKNSHQAIFDNKRKALRYQSEKEFIKIQDEAYQTELGHLKRAHDEELAGYNTLAELKKGLQGRISEDEMKNIRTWADGKEALNKAYQKRELELSIAHLEQMVKVYEGLDLTMLTPEQRKEVMKWIDEAGNKLAEMKAKAKEPEQEDKKKGAGIGQKGSTDVLGMSSDDWKTMFDNFKTGTDMIGTMVAAVGALQNAFTTYFQYVDTNERKQIQQFEANNNRKKTSLKRQLDTGAINQETYKKKVIEADIELDRKKHEIAVRQAKREKAMAVAQVIMNTAGAIMGIWKDFPKMDFGATAAIMSGVVGALGAVQVATILAQPLPTAEGYESGFNTLPEEYPITREQDGRRFTVRRRRISSGLVNRPTHFIAGERGVEMVIDNPTWTTYSPELKNAIYTANARAKGYEGGLNTLPKNTPLSSGNDDVLMMAIQIIKENKEVMQDIRDYGIKAYIEKNARNGKEIHEMTKEYTDLNDKNKH